MKIFKKVFLLAAVILLVVFFAGCNGDINSFSSLFGSIIKSPSPFGAVGRKVKDEYDGFLGCGYDVIRGPYYQSDAAKMCVLDMELMVEDGLIYRDEKSNRTTETKTNTGTDIYSYMQNVSSSSNVNVKSLFGGSLNVNFGLNTSAKLDAKTSFAQSSILLTKKYEYVNMAKMSRSNFLKKYVYAAFKNDYLLNDNVTPEELFNKYGTHIMLSVSYGGRLDVGYLYKNVEQIDDLAIKASVEASFSKVTASTSIDYSESTKEFLTRCDLTVKTFGGKVDEDMKTLENAAKNYSKWAESIENTDNLALIKGGDLSNDNEMLPIWMLIDTEMPKDATKEQKAEVEARKVRQDSIKAAYEKMLKDLGSSLDTYIVPPTYIKDIYFGAGGNIPTAIADLKSKTDEHIEIIEKDLNCGAGGAFIYLGYTLTEDPNEALTKTALAFDPASWPETYVYRDLKDNSITYKYHLRLDYDLNMSSGGDDIRLYYSRDKAAGGPIRELYVQIVNNGTDDIDREILGEKGWIRTCDIYFTNCFDLNRNAGGKDIYLWYRR